jgi:alanyl-tRNA synthetase
MTTLTTPPITVAQIRKTFLDFYASKGHTVVASSPLVPGNDPTLMFVNSGMVQFKDVFLGTDKRPYVRAASVQACLRAGGKHNDLENVGYTARHHTFFEMLGNWSFGDYFKRDSLKWGWELLTQVYKLPAEKLWATVYIDDDEAYDIWTKEIGVPPERVVRIGDNKGAKYASDNFWMMADTGPCGPCSEIFYDHGPQIPGGPPGSPDADGDRYIEIWNHVFMQFDMQPDGSVKKLPAPCVDTGMGLERLAAILQHVHSNYEIDIFDALIKAASRETGCEDLNNKSLRVIADHIRATAFLVSDGVIPSNEGRGYVQRRIVRRAIRHGYKLGKKTPFFHKLVPDLVKLMGEAYPKLKADEQHIMDVLRVEEERFFETLEYGMSILNTATSEKHFAMKWLEVKTGYRYAGINVKNSQGYALDGEFVRDGDFLAVEVVNPEPTTQYLSELYDKISKIKDEHSGYKELLIVVSGKTPQILLDRMVAAEFPVTFFEVSGSELAQFRNLDGSVAFKLHDTYGFPLDLTQDVCREHGVVVDEAGFNAAMTKQKEQARAAGKFKMDRALEYSGVHTTFSGYELLASDSKVVGVYIDGVAVNAMNAGQGGVIVLDTTPFYAESGGQVGDEGVLSGGASSKAMRFDVSDVQKIKADVFGHHGTLTTGTIKVGETVNAQVNTARRAATVRNHSATHLMHKALREVLGAHVQQKGSLVDADKTRFDFAHNAPMTDAQVREVEQKVNAEILANVATHAEVMPLAKAEKSGAMMLFGEKYGEEVRVLEIGTSKELCGGTHVQRTGDIGLFKIVLEAGVAAGVRRVEAITGENALVWAQEQERTINEAAHALKSTPAELTQRITQMQEHVKALEKQLDAAKGKLASSQGDELVNLAIDIKGVKFLAATLDGADSKALRETMDKLKDKLKSAVLLLASSEGGKVQLAAGVTADLTSKIKAGELVNAAALAVGGKGGGRPDFAMAGGTEVSKMAEALAAAKVFASSKL